MVLSGGKGKLGANAFCLSPSPNSNFVNHQTPSKLSRSIGFTPFILVLPDGEIFTFEILALAQSLP